MKDNGGCQQICVVHGYFGKCECNLGYRLQADEKSCKAGEILSSLLILKQKNYKQCHIMTFWDLFHNEIMGPPQTELNDIFNNMSGIRTHNVGIMWPTDGPICYIHDFIIVFFFLNDILLSFQINMHIYTITLPPSIYLLDVFKLKLTFECIRWQD